MSETLLGMTVAALVLALAAWWRAGRALDLASRREAPAAPPNRVRGEACRCGICRQVLEGGEVGIVAHLASPPAVGFAEAGG